MFPRRLSCCCARAALVAILASLALPDSAGAGPGGPCPGVCDAATAFENEPDCGQPVDMTNPGCNGNPPLFTPVQCGDTICATSFWEPASNGRDLDWFELVLSETATMTWSVTGEFALETLLFVPPCSEPNAISSAVAEACGTATIVECLAPGTYYFAVTPQLLPDSSVPCGASYAASLNCAPCDVPPNDSCSFAVPVAVPSSISGTTINAFYDFGVPFCGTPVGGRGVWYQVPGTGHTMTAAVCGPAVNFDAAINVFCGGCGALFCVGGNTFDPQCANPAGAQLTWCSAPGETYFILVQGLFGDTGDFVLDVTDGEPCEDPLPCSNCEMPCSLGATEEGEANCGLNEFGQPDTSFNGGCSANPPAFSPLACGQEICGTAAFNGVFRDDDWYSITIDQPSIITWEVHTDFPAETFIAIPYPECPSMYPLVTGGEGERCEVVTLQTPCLLPGTYYLTVAPRFTGAPVECGRQYRAIAMCEPCEVCEIDTSGAIPEGEPNCGLPVDTVNGGCPWGVPPLYTPLPCGALVTGTSVRPGFFVHDTDVFEITLAESARVDFELAAEYPPELVLTMFTPDCGSFETIDARLRSDLCTNERLSACLEPGSYQLFMRPAEATYHVPFVYCRDYVIEAVCSAPSAPANDDCVNAIDLSVPGSATGENVCAQPDDMGFCFANLSGRGVWYRVIGDGTRFTATTCESQTNFNTVIGVFCGDCETGLFCVAGDEDDLACEAAPIDFRLSSTASWCSESGRAYYVLVAGAGSAAGDFVFSVTSDGAPCDNPVACAPCAIEFPAGAIDENEGNCGLPNDTVNGGCNLNPPLFSAIGCGDVIAGTIASNPGQGRDTDWYELVLTEPAAVTFSVESEFFAEIGLIDTGTGGEPSCFFPALDPSVQGSPCTPARLSLCLEAGTWRFFVAPLFTSEQPCGTRYVARLSCGCNCAGDANGDGLVDGADVQDFIDCALGDGSVCPGCTCADMDGNGVVDELDAGPLVERLLAEEACTP